MSPAETERLVLLIEECSEIIHATTKILRFGYNTPEKRGHLEEEIGNLQAVLTILHRNDDISWANIDLAATKKLDTIQQYLRYNDV